ncbi:MAG TPA: hypothetical protein VM261_37780 [Kofleriaceae bacterium]|nr:hypothetical protein [Kofleriaceae bacterium]
MSPSIKKTILRSVALSVAITTILLAALHCEARADDGSPALRAYTGVAMDTGVVGKLGVERDVAAPRADLTLSTPLLVTLPILRPGGGDVDVRAGLRAELRRGRRFVLAATASPFVRTMSSTYYSVVAFGVDVEIAPTLTLGRAAIGLELGHDRTVADHFTHTQAFRDRYYADVHDGWYDGSASRLRAGLRGEVRVTHTLALRTRLGANASTAGTPEVIPFYGEVGASLSF